MAQIHKMLQHTTEEEARAAGIAGITTDEYEQEYIPLSDLVRAEQEIIHVEEPKGFDRSTATLEVEDRMLSPRIQLLMWFIIDAVNDFFEQGHCLESLDATNILVSKWTLKPRFRNFRVAAADKSSPAGVESNMSSLAAVFEETILANANVRPPFEVMHLIKVMKGGDAASMLFLIRFHPSLVPLQNRLAYFDKMASHAFDVLRATDPEGYSYVMYNLFFQEYWDSWVAENEHLKRFYDNAPERYWPQGNAADKTAAEEVLRFHRDMLHTPSPPDDAVKLNDTDRARMLYSVMDGLLAIMAECFQRMSRLRYLELQALFPRGVVEY